MPNKHGIKYIPKQFISIEKIFEVVVYFFCYLAINSELGEKIFIGITMKRVFFLCETEKSIKFSKH